MPTAKDKDLTTQEVQSPNQDPLRKVPAERPSDAFKKINSAVTAPDLPIHSPRRAHRPRLAVPRKPDAGELRRLGAEQVR